MHYDMCMQGEIGEALLKDGAREGEGRDQGRMREEQDEAS